MKNELTQLDSDRLLEMLLVEMNQNGRKLMPLEVDLATIFAVCGQIQLAARHPSNTGSSALVGQQFVDTIAIHVSKLCPAVSESIRRGWLEEYDQEKEIDNET